MKAKLKDQMKEAMKAKDKVRLDTIRSLLSEIQYDEMQKGINDLDSDGCLAVCQRELKKRKEELEFAGQADRPELKEKLLVEMATIESFLPKQLSASEIESILNGMKQANSAINMGIAMKQLKDTYAGQYDGKLASEVAKRILS